MRIQRRRETCAQKAHQFSVDWLGKLTEEERAGFPKWFFAEYRRRLPARQACGCEGLRHDAGGRGTLRTPQCGRTRIRTSDLILIRDAL